MSGVGAMPYVKLESWRNSWNIWS